VNRKDILSCSSALALFLPHAAIAQTPAAREEAPPAAATDAAAPAAGVGDIVVTAQKRTSTLQRTPASVQVIGAAELVTRGVTDLVRLQTAVTGVIIQPNRTGIFMFSRGLGQADAQYQTSPAIEVQADGLTLPRSAQQFAMFDVGDIQVLKGPQGILYGRYGIGGAVLINSKRPTYDGFKAEGTFEYGNYDLVHGFAAVNVPVGDAAGLRASVDYNRRDGYLTNGANDLDQISGRLSFQADPTDRLTLFLAATGSHRKGQGFAQITFPRPGEANGDPYVVLPVPQSGVVNGVNFDDYHNRGFLDQKSFLINGQVEYQVSDGLSLSYVGGYFFNDSEQVNAFQNKTGNSFVNYASTYYVEHSWDIQNEVRLSYDRDGLTAVIGALHHRFEAQDNIVQAAYKAGTLINGPQSPVETNWAIFGDIVVPVSDRLRVEVGARQSWDYKYTDGRLSGQPNVSINKSNFPGFKYFAWKIGAEFDIADRVLSYANVQTGYLPGAYQTATDTVLASLGLGRRYESQEVTAYQAGIKSRFLDNRVRLNVEGFYYDYKNFQVTQRITDPTNPNVFQSPYANIRKSRIYGADIDLNAQLIEGGTFNIGLSLLNTKILDSGFAKLSVIQPNGLARNELGQNGFPALDPSLRGYDLPFSPKVMLNLGYEQIFAIGRGQVIANVASHYESRKWLDYSQSPLFPAHHPSFWKTDVSLTYRAPDNRWNIGLWGRNLENSATFSTFTPNQARVGGVLIVAYSYVYVDAPRTYGVRAGFNF